MKKIILLVVGVFTFISMRSQVVIHLQLPAMGLTLKSQLWNMSVVNTGNKDIQAQVQLLLTNVKTNQKVLSGSTRTLFFPKGLRQITANDVKPVTYNVMSPGTGIDANPDGLLPVGVYDVCFSLQKRENDYTTQIAEECITIQIEPLGPPQLAYPNDQETIDRTRPLFSWMPPTPIAAFNFLTYSYTLVQVQPTQSAADAIQQNIPLATMQRLTPLSYQYPSALPELDTGRLYAWRITAMSGGNAIANSETWTFRVKKGQPSGGKVNMQSAYFIKLNREISSSYSISKGVLYYEYNNEWNDKKAELHLYDISTADRRELKVDSVFISLQYGQNFKQLDLNRQNGVVDKHVYLLELINGKKEKWYLKTEYRKP